MSGFGAGSTALMLVDVQVASVGPGLWRADEVLGNIATLLAAARASGAPVVHVQDDGGPGSAFEVGTPGWAFHPAAAPRAGEPVVRKRHNSAFRGTDLAEDLRTRGIERLVLVGMHTEFCVDTTVRVAFELGFRLVVPDKTNSTYDRDGLSAADIHRHHNRGIWAGRFAEVCSVEEAVAMLGAAGARR